MPEEKKAVRKKIAAAADLNNFMRDYYLELDAAAQEGRPQDRLVHERRPG
ncbi:MAG: hypothetical protein MZV70_12225 [Desulfobacterales bacterium]|nr:hypothetical protein [Desulfobacterales bacterium]